MDVLDRIENGFKNMVKTGKVDLSIISVLSKVRGSLFELKKNFSGKKDILRQFSIFHAIETQIRIMDHMIHRVKIAPKIYDNPKVADDALIILPYMKLIRNSLKSKVKFDSRYIMSLSSKLQIVAMKSCMYPSPKEVTENINKKVLENNFNRFISNIGEELERV